MWRIESGVMTFATNRRAVRFAATAVELYEGGMLSLWNAANTSTGGAGRMPQADDAINHEANVRKMVEANLFFNDVYIWAQVAHLAGTGTRVTGAACCLDYGVTQGWLAGHTSSHRANMTPISSPWSLDYYVHHFTHAAGSIERQRNFKDSNKHPPNILARNIDYDMWRGVGVHEWNTRTKGVPLDPRVARCGCRYDSL